MAGKQNRSARRRQRRRQRQQNQGRRVTPVVNVNAPSAVGVDVTSYSRIKPHPRHPSGIILEGRDLIDVVTANTLTPVGTNLSNVLISPTAYEGTRMRQLGGSWDKYRFRRMAFHLVPSQGTDSTGQVAMAWDPDPSDPTPPASLVGLREIIAHRCSKVGNTWLPLVLEVVPEGDDQAFYTNRSEGDERLTYQGQVYVSAASNIATASNWNLWFEYELELWEPSLEEIQVQVSNFTTSASTPAASTAKGLFNNIVPAMLIGTVQEAPLLSDGTDQYFLLQPGVYEVLTTLQGVVGGAGTSLTGLNFVKDDPTAILGSVVNNVLAQFNTSNSGSGAGTPEALYSRSIVQVLKTAYRMYAGFTLTGSNAGHALRVSIMQSLINAIV